MSKYVYMWLTLNKLSVFFQIEKFLALVVFW
jgi:hypothetical protein